MTPTSRHGILSPGYRGATVGSFALIAFIAFESLAVTTVMPDVARQLGGLSLYAVSFAAPLASAVIGMVVAGMWSDQDGPAKAMVTSLVLFAVGLLICGAAPSMNLLVVGRILQGLGGGALIVALYVVVGKVYPADLQASVFASFAAAWVLPSLFGPALAALVAKTVGWRWVFAGVVIFVVIAGAMVAPTLRRIEQARRDDSIWDVSKIVWATLAAGGVLAVELLGSRRGVLLALAGGSLILVFVSVRRLTPPGTLLGARGLPAVIGTRGLLSGGFIASEAYIVYVQQEQWGWSATRAGLALTGVGLTWALSSQVQARLGSRVSDTLAMRVATTLVTTGLVLLVITVALDISPWLAAGCYLIAGAGMGFGFPRTSVATLAQSSDADRGFNSSALAIADSLGAALALAFAGILFAWAKADGYNQFAVVFALGTAIVAIGLWVAPRTAREA